MDLLIRAIVENDPKSAGQLLSSDTSLVTQAFAEPTYYDIDPYHWIYAGDTALHLAAAGYRVEIVRLLLHAGADPNSSANHRNSNPLHYASDGYVSGPRYDPDSQVHTIQALL